VQAIERDEEALRLAGEQAVQARAEFEGLARREASGALSARTAQKRHDELEAAIRRHEADAARIGRVLDERRTILARLDGELQRAAFDDAVELVAQRGRRQETAARKFVAALAELNRVRPELEKARAASDDAIAKAAELRPEGVDAEIAVDDEPYWSNALELVAFLTIGARRPAADAAERLERQRRVQADSENVRVAQVVREVLKWGRSSDFARFERLPVELRQEGVRRAAVMVSAIVVDADGAAAAKVRERLERLRSTGGAPVNR
jgi:hypothetical protein